MWIKFTEVLNATKRQFLLAIWLQTGSRIRETFRAFFKHARVLDWKQSLNKFACIVHSKWIFSRWPHCVTRGRNTRRALFMIRKSLRALFSIERQRVIDGNDYRAAHDSVFERFRSFYLKSIVHYAKWLSLEQQKLAWMSGDSNARQGGKLETR